LLLRDHTGILHSRLVDHLHHNVANHHSGTPTNYWQREWETELNIAEVNLRTPSMV
jgi:hypothetical protein